MNNEKSSEANELVKSFLIVCLPILFFRAILAANNASGLVQGMVMSGLIFGSVFIRKQIKTRENNDIYIFLMFILFLPAGFYYLWRYSKRNNMIRLLVSAVFVIVFIVILNLPKILGF